MFGVPLFGIGFLAAALLAAKVDYTTLGMVVAVVLSVGFGLAALPGEGTPTAAREIYDILVRHQQITHGDICQTMRWCHTTLGQVWRHKEDMPME